MDKCTCQNCINNDNQNAKFINNIMMSDELGFPVHVATIEIKAVALLVEPWMLESAMRVATKHLSRSIANYSFGKVLN